MSEEDTTALVPEVPVPEAAAPTEAPAQPDPYEKRYSDLRSEFDKRNSLLDRATKGDVDAIRELGFDVDAPDEPDPTEYEDPYAEQFASTKKELDELKQWKQAQEAERIATRVAQDVEKLAADNGLSLTDYDRSVIFNNAVSGEKIDQESVKSAFDAHKAYLDQVAEALAPPGRPSRPVKGQAATKQPDLDNEQERIAWMTARLQGDA